MAAEVSVELAPLPQDETLLERKSELFKKRGLKLHFPIGGGSALKKQELLEHVVEAARVWNLNEAEYYFIEDDEKGPFSPRNELAALSMVHRMLSSSPHCEEPLVQALTHMVLERLEKYSNEPSDEFMKEALPCTREAEAKLLRWCTDRGVQSRLFIADFQGYGRGAAAISDIEVGELVLEIPKDMIISEDVAVESEMGKCLSGFGDLRGDTVALLWSIQENTNASSKFAPYFSSLPRCFNTGLGFGVDGLQGLEGTVAFEQIIQAKEHLRRVYNMLFPALSKSHPEAFPEEIFTWENFLWASELWYSNSIKVGFPDGRVQTCLVPLLGLLNHSAVPHITHFSKIDEKTNALKVHALRRCEANKQCFLSYGTLSNADFLCFYGFVPKNNPYDTILIDTEIPDAVSSPHRAALCERYSIEASHMVRPPWLSKSSLTKAGLPSKLLAALRIQFMEEEEAETFSGDPRYSVVSLENEANVNEAISTTLEMLIGNSDESSNETWDALLARGFRQMHRMIWTQVTEELQTV